MLTRSIMMRGLFATMCAVIIALGAVAQPPSAPAGAARGIAGGGTNNLPDIADVVAAAYRFQEWLDVFTAPRPDDEAAHLPIEGCGGVCIIIRHRGRMVGVGQDVTGDDLMVRRAAGRAMSQAWGDESISRLPESDRLAIGRSLTFEIEATGPASPLPGRTFGQLAEQIDPGIEGILLRRDEDKIALFPARLLAMNNADRLDSQLHALSAGFGLPAMGYGKLSERHGVRAYRFETIHLAQRGPGRRPMHLLRGRARDAKHEIAWADLRAFADGVVDHLLMSLWVGDEPLGMSGDYFPHINRHKPLIASPRDQALCAWALMAYAEAEGVAAENSARARLAASGLLVELTATDPTEEPPLEDPAACAAIICALTAHSSLLEEPVLEGLLRQSSEVLIASAEHRDDAPAVRGGAMRAMIARAMTGLCAHDPGTVTVDQARIALDAAWASVTEPQQISLLPWIYEAETAFALITGAPRRHEEDFRRLAALLDAARIMPGAGIREDLIGGFMLSGTGRILPDAQSCRPAGFYAAVLDDRAVISDQDAPLALARHLSTMRFIMRLTVTDADVWAIRAPQKALGGVRRSPAASDQPVVVQAMCVLTAVETLRHVPRANAPETADISR